MFYVKCHKTFVESMSAHMKYFSCLIGEKQNRAEHFTVHIGILPFRVQPFNSIKMLFILLVMFTIIIWYNLFIYFISVLYFVNTQAENINIPIQVIIISVFYFLVGRSLVRMDRSDPIMSRIVVHYPRPITLPSMLCRKSR